MYLYYRGRFGWVYEVRKYTDWQQTRDTKKTVVFDPKKERRAGGECLFEGEEEKEVVVL